MHRSCTKLARAGRTCMREPRRVNKHGLTMISRKGGLDMGNCTFAPLCDSYSHMSIASKPSDSLSLLTTNFDCYFGRGVDTRRGLTSGSCFGYSRCIVDIIMELVEIRSRLLGTPRVSALTTSHKLSVCHSVCALPDSPNHAGFDAIPLLVFFHVFRFPDSLQRVNPHHTLLDMGDCTRFVDLGFLDCQAANACILSPVETMCELDWLSGVIDGDTTPQISPCWRL